MFSLREGPKGVGWPTAPIISNPSEALSSPPLSGSSATIPWDGLDISPALSEGAVADNNRSADKRVHDRLSRLFIAFPPWKEKKWQRGAPFNNPSLFPLNKKNLGIYGGEGINFQKGSDRWITAMKEGLPGYEREG